MCEFKAPARATERAPLLYRAEPSFLFHPLALPLPRSFNPLFIRHILFSPFDKRVSTRPPCPFAPLPALSCSSTLAGCGFYVSGLIKRFAPPSLPLSLSRPTLARGAYLLPPTCNPFLFIIFFSSGLSGLKR